MKKIEYEQYELNDLLRTLEYAKNKKYVDYKEGILSENQYKYEAGLIQDLIRKIPIKSVK